ncbi:hypothetical protein [Bosea caraganae]|uniref:hypothetical protein n=1 Tax=Bosea caraganae TaxID=2763117 RepID=UPI0015F0A40C|nr:hypothetical protein [Bosea caraganae]
MLSSRPVAALFGALSLGLAAFTVAPASAAPVSAGPLQATQAQAGGDLLQQAQYYGPRRHYGYRPHYGYGRPVYRPRCFVTDRRVWNGYRWVIRPVRVCR